MKKYEECLDLVLKTLADNGDLLCFYECDEFNGFPDLKLIASPAYQKLFADLELSNEESIQLLEILRDKGYIDYTIGRGGIGNTVFFKIKVNNNTGTINTNGTAAYEDSMSQSVLKPTLIKLFLIGKFFILNEGGFMGILEREEQEQKRIKALEESHLRNEIRIANLTKWLVIATFFLGLGAIVEVLKYFHVYTCP